MPRKLLLSLAMWDVGWGDNQSQSWEVGLALPQSSHFPPVPRLFGFLSIDSGLLEGRAWNLERTKNKKSETRLL